MFLPSKATATAITKTIKENFTGSWKNWTAVRKDTEAVGRMLRSFLEKCTWLPDQQKQVERVFHKRCSHRYSEILWEARSKNAKLSYMRESSWAELKEYWETDEYKKYCEKAKKNRVSDKGGCTHTGGSVNTATHHRRMEEREQRPVTLPELHLYLHMKEDTGDFATDRVRAIQESFEAGLAEYYQRSGAADIDPE